MRSPGRRLVVDADVGRAAADPAKIERGAPIDPRALQISKALRQIKEARHTVVFAPTLTAEWDKHAPEPRAGRKWLGEMLTAGLVARHDADPEDPALARLVDERLPAPDQRVAQKDLHVVSLALVHGDRRVISLDGRAREKFARLKDGHPGLRQLHWSAPDTEAAALWLRDGAKDDPEFSL
jgi:hypothetical protein